MKLYRYKFFLKYVQDLYAKHYKTLMREIKKGLNKWRDMPCSWIGKLNFAKMSVFLQWIVGLHTMLINISTGLYRYQQADSNIYVENQRN